jgi:hypothetical protein
MKIVMKKIDELKPYEKNPKLHPQEQIDGLTESIRRFGITQPVVVDKDDVLVIGHGRLEAARAAGLASIPAVLLSDLSKKEIKALRLLDNRIAETGWDNEILKLELPEITIDMGEFNIAFDSIGAESPTKLESVDVSIDESGAGRFIYIYTNESERDFICNRLGIDGEKKIYDLKADGGNDDN